MNAVSLYFIQDGDDGPVKIGLSTQPAKRLSYLQVGNPRTLRLIACWPDSDPDEERELHDFLRGERISGEWFHPRAALMFAEAHE